MRQADDAAAGRLGELTEVGKEEVHGVALFPLI